MPHPTHQCWVLSDGAAGNEKQALALAHALGFQPRMFKLATRVPWRWFAPRLLPGAQHAFGVEFSKALTGPWPQLAIGCGRQAALATRCIRRECNGAARTVQILDPRIDPAHFDLVIAPRHDQLVGPNVVQTLGALNVIDEDFLTAARQRFSHLQHLPAPRTVLLLGGPTRAFTLDQNGWNSFATTLETLVRRESGSLSLAASRRTPPWLREAARTRFETLPGLRWLDSTDGENPYDGLLAWADRIIVTPDSVNMPSEAAATTAPLFAWQPHTVRGKLTGFLAELAQRDRLRALDEEAAPWPVQPLRDMPQVVARVREMLR